MNTTFTWLFAKLAKYTSPMDPMRCFLRQSITFNGRDSGNLQILLSIEPSDVIAMFGNTTEGLFFWGGFFSRNYFDSLELQISLNFGSLALSYQVGNARISEPYNIYLGCPAGT